MNDDQRTEYNKITQEITTRLTIRYTCELTVYTASLVFIGLGWELNSYIFFLLTFLIIIPINFASASNLNMIVLLGEYTRFFYERNHSSLRWESEYSKIMNHPLTKKYMRGKIYNAGHYGSSLMGFIAFASTILHIFTKKLVGTNGLLIFLLASIGLMVTIISNAFIVHSDDRRRIYRNFFQNVSSESEGSSCHSP